MRGRPVIISAPPTVSFIMRLVFVWAPRAMVAAGVGALGVLLLELLS